KHLRTVLAGVVILAPAIIAIIIHEVVVILCLPQAHLIASDLFPISLLVPGMASAVFAPKLAVSLIADLLPVVPAIVVFPLTLACQTLLSRAVVLLITPVAPVTVISVVPVIAVVPRVIAAVSLFDLTACVLLLTCAFGRTAVALNANVITLTTLLVDTLLIRSLLCLTLLCLTLLCLFA